MTASLEPAQGAADSGDDSDSAGGSGDDGENDPTEDSGQDTASAGEALEAEGALGDLFADANKETAQASQEDFEDLDIQDGITTLEDLDLITEGKFHYSDKGVPLNGGNNDGVYDFELDIDFGSRTIGGDNATNRINVTLPSAGPHTAEYTLGELDFEEMGPDGVFQYAPISNNDTSGCPLCSTADVTVVLLNTEGMVANQAAHSIEFTDTATAYNGEGLSGPRTE
jgi:hypothetical protein